MINIVERTSKTGKLIHLNPRDWKCPRQIEEALFTEEHAPEDYGQYDKPSQYPAGTVAELIHDELTARGIPAVLL